MKKLFIVFCLLPNIINAMEVDKKNLYIPGRLGNISVFKTEEGFEVEEPNSNRVSVASHRLGKDLRQMNTRQVAKFLKSGYLSVNQYEDGQYSLEARPRLRGGGLWGAWLGCVIGKAAVHFVGHGTIQIIGICSGPAYLPTVAALEAALLPTVIEPMSNVVALGFGIAGGVATGPV